MTIGTFYVATGQIPGWTWVLSPPYATLVTTVLFGKHIDKIEADTSAGRCGSSARRSSIPGAPAPSSSSA
jgi:hypothetical protein